MSIFLDPNIYCYSIDEWQQGSALDRMHHLTTFLESLIIEEDRLEAKNQVELWISDILMSATYEMNPNINTPPNGFYFRQYVSKLLPTLLRRKITLEAPAVGACRVSECLNIHDCVIEEALIFALDEISTEDATKITYIFDSSRVSLTLGGGIFSAEFEINEVTGRRFLDECDLFPLSSKACPDTAIVAAAEVLKDKLLTDDATWSEHSVSKAILHENFLPSIARADFGNEERIYQRRIVYSLLQILAARNLTINEHSMNPEKIWFDRKWHGKWNAYVFRSGPSDIDSRCSRIYYAKIDGGVLLYEYNGDAH